MDPAQVLQLLRDNAANSDLESNDDAIKGLKRNSLLRLAKHVGLPLKPAMKKVECLELVVLFMADHELVSDALVESVEQGTVWDTTVSAPGESVEVIQARARAEQEKLQIQKEIKKQEHEAEKEKLQMQMQMQQEIDKIREEAAAKLKLAEAELKSAQAKAIAEGGVVGGQFLGTAPSSFDVAKHVRLVPPFQDKDLDSYFVTFERTAQSLDWPPDKWSILLASSLKNKAQTAYASMNPEDMHSYEMVKSAVLKSYELVPEAYRQKFRSLQKGDKETYVEYVRQKERHFDRWCKSRNVDSYANLKNLIQLEDFRDNLPRAVKAHIDDLDVQNVHKAAERADDYTVIHKLSGNSNGAQNQSQKGSKGRGGNHWSRAKSGNGNGSHDGQKQSQGSDGHSRSGVWCDHHRSPTHSTEDCSYLKYVRERENRQSPMSGSFQRNPKEDRWKGQGSKPKGQGSEKVQSVGLTVSRFGTVDSVLNDMTQVPFKSQLPRVLYVCSDDASDHDDTASLSDVSLDTESVTEVASGGWTESVQPEFEVLCDTSADTKVDKRFEAFISFGTVALPSGGTGEHAASPSESIGSVCFSDSSHSVFMTPSESDPSVSSEVGQRSGEVKVCILRDTGSSQSLMKKGVLDLRPDDDTGTQVLVSGIAGQTMAIPLFRVRLCSGLLSPEFQEVVVGVTETLPVDNVDVLIGNDLAGSRVQSEPIVSSVPTDSSSTQELEANHSECLPSCVVTRAQSAKQSRETANTDDDVVLADTFFPRLGDLQLQPKVTNESMIEAQKSDHGLQKHFDAVLDEVEAEKVPTCFMVLDGVLVRKWRDPTLPADYEWAIKHQIVVPQVLRSHVLELAHDLPLSGHLGVKKTKTRILENFWWPSVSRDVAEYVRTCHVCQVVGKPNQGPKRVPLHPIPIVDEPFSRLMIDIVGPLPKTSKGNQYVLTIMCTTTRFPEAIPLRSCTTKVISQALLKFFTQFGIPRTLCSDQASNFTSQALKEIMDFLGVSQVYGCAYRPQTQGAIERFHQTLKTMIRAYVFEHEKDWDSGLPFLVFAMRDSKQESLKFSPNELVFGYKVRGPLQLLKDQCLQSKTTDSLVSYVTQMKGRVQQAVTLARENMEVAQSTMKEVYDRGAVDRGFKVGDQVLALLPIQGNSLQISYRGPYKVLKKLDDVNYVVETPDRRKATQQCHINMLKAYHSRDVKAGAVGVTSVSEVGTVVVKDEDETSCDDFEVTIQPIKLNNSVVLSDLSGKLGHLSPERQDELSSMVHEFSDLFPDTPGRAVGMYHDVDVGDARPVKQHPYRVGPEKKKIMDKEIAYMLENGIIEPCASEWSSPSLLTPKPDGSWRFCSDFRRVNALTKSDCFPIPRVDDLIDDVSGAKFVSKFDLLKGYWQIPLTERAKDISAFCVGDALYRYLVCPFGLKNSGITFQRFMNQVVAGLRNTRVYVDDLIIYSDTWEEHVTAIRALFARLRKHRLTVNLVKSDFAKATVQYLGHEVGQGKIRPSAAKIQAILDLPPPENKKALMRLIGMCGFYRRFCPNLSTIVTPLTDLTSGKVKFVWTDECQTAFEKVKRILTNCPVIVSPQYDREFRLYCDSSDSGAGSSLMQCDDEGIEHPVCYFSKKYNKYQRRYSTVEKEALSLLLSVKFFDIYLSSSAFPVQVFTDHNPLTFINRMKAENQRLLRWSLTLQDYNIQVNHVKGSDNVVADALSRL